MRCAADTHHPWFRGCQGTAEFGQTNPGEAANAGRSLVPTGVVALAG